VTEKIIIKDPSKKKREIKAAYPEQTRIIPISGINAEITNCLKSKFFLSFAFAVLRQERILRFNMS